MRSQAWEGIWHLKKIEQVQVDAFIELASQLLKENTGQDLEANLMANLMEFGKKEVVLLAIKNKMRDTFFPGGKPVQMAEQNNAILGRVYGKISNMARGFQAAELNETLKDATSKSAAKLLQEVGDGKSAIQKNIAIFFKKMEKLIETSEELNQKETLGGQVKAAKNLVSINTANAEIIKAVENPKSISNEDKKACEILT